MDATDKKPSFASRLKMFATTHISDIAPKMRFVASAIVTAAGVIGILSFSLAPVLTTYPIYAVRHKIAARARKNATDSHRYQKLEFDYVCGGDSTKNATFATHCTSETKDNPELSALSCDFRSMTATQFLQLQNDGECVVANVKLTNETGAILKMQDIQEERDKQKEHEDKVKGAIGMLTVLGICMLIVVAFYFHTFVKAIRAFLFYRRLICSDPPLSPSALRGHFLTPDWLKYFRRALAFSCSLLAYHGMFALLVHLPCVSGRGLLVWGLAWAVGPVFSLFLPGFCNDAMLKRALYLRSLPDSVFENGVIDHEEIELIRLKRRAKAMRLERKKDDIKKKYEYEMEQLRKEYRTLGNDFE